MIRFDGVSAAFSYEEAFERISVVIKQGKGITDGEYSQPSWGNWQIPDGVKLAIDWSINADDPLWVYVGRFLDQNLCIVYVVQNRPHGMSANELHAAHIADRVPLFARDRRLIRLKTGDRNTSSKLLFERELLAFNLLNNGSLNLEGHKEQYTFLQLKRLYAKCIKSGFPSAVLIGSGDKFVTESYSRRARDRFEKHVTNRGGIVIHEHEPVGERFMREIDGVYFYPFAKELIEATPAHLNLK